MASSLPILGLTGGIASGKSYWSARFAAHGCVVIDADALVAEIYQRRDVLEQLGRWWGSEVVQPDGGLNRKFVARIIFADQEQRERLERLIHPLVSELREARTREAAEKMPRPRAVVWDIPLLHEVGLAPSCTRLLFVEAPLAVRQRRAAQRGWSAAELAKREAAQVPLEAKRAAAHIVLPGDGSVTGAEADGLVESVLQEITGSLQPAQGLRRSSDWKSDGIFKKN